MEDKKKKNKKQVKTGPMEFYHTEGGCRDQRAKSTGDGEGGLVGGLVRMLRPPISSLYLSLVRFIAGTVFPLTKDSQTTLDL